MARERSRHKPEKRRWPEPPADPIGRLDDVLATLEAMLDGRGIPPASRPAGAAGPEREARDPGTLPLLSDVVAPAPEFQVDGQADGQADGGLDAAGPGEGEPEPAQVRKPFPLGFEIIEDEALPRIGDLELDLDSPDIGPAIGPVIGPTIGPAIGPAIDPGGDRYGDTLPPSLDPEVYRHLIDRLANEIDVIVQTGTEEAMQRAAADIAARVREHVAIILPEVIEEIVRMSRRPRD